MSFVHLHLHTQYSLLEGAIRVDSLFDRVKELGMSAVAVTDTQNLFGAIDFYNTARKAGVKPIIGCELQMALEGMPAAQGVAPSRQELGPRFHALVVLCKDLQGYRNLCQIVSRAYQQSFVQASSGKKDTAPAGTPRALVTRALLDQYGDGLIVLSAGLRGLIPCQILKGDEEGAVASLQWFKKRFGENFYLEIQDTGIPELEAINETLAKLGEKHGVELVGTSNCHYLKPEDAEAHEILQCIETGKKLDLDRPKSLVPAEYYLKPPELMRERLERFPRAYENTLKIAEKCDLQFKFKDDKGRTIYQLPDFRPNGIAKSEPFDTVGYFREQAKIGLKERFEEFQFERKVQASDWASREPLYWARLEDELTMIARTGFSGYFLIVADFINWAKRNGIPVGPGRGSGAGSLVAFVLKITDVDPIEFNLLFERFINPERVSMPDFDVDFCQDRRGEVIEYVSKKYGSENVCQIITFGKLQARAAIKDVGRVLEMSFAETDQITKLLPDELGIEIQQAIDREPRLREKMELEPKTAKVIEYALAIEGLYRNAGIHAAGVIITEEPIVNYCALYVTKDGDVVSQFDKDFAEQIGLVKYDFLGLKTLTVIDNAVKLVRQAADPGSTDADFALERMNYFDPSVFALISSGDTDGVFQVESSGMKDLCQRIQPNSLEDLTAINALYRPGPLGSGMVDDFIERKHGRKPIVYDVDALAQILKDTYGVILYQEQVMQTARELAGYSLGQADMLRRAMGKKKPEEMAEHRAIFVKGATEKGIAAAKAESIFDLMAKFAEYGFNKSHSAAYGVLTYQTAYLKRHYPAEFMAALMTTEMSDTDKLTKYISNARSNGILVLAPDVNHSEKRFSVEKTARDGQNSQKAQQKAIRFGLEAIKGVGGVAVDVIIEQRTQARFKNVMDFCRRVSTRKANKKVLESLTLAGAFDSIAEVNRATLFGSLETLLAHAGDEQEERELGQNSLFDSFREDEVKLVAPSSSVFKHEEEWPEARRLALEKQVVGFYVSGHPMDRWQKICENWLGWSTERLKQAAEDRAAAKKTAPAPQPTESWGQGGRYQRPPKTEVRLCGMLAEQREIMTKKGSRMAFGVIEDLTGKLELVFFPEAYAANQEMLKSAVGEALPVVVTGEVEFGDEAPKILVKTLEFVEEAHKGRVQQVVVRIKPGEVSADQLRALKKSLLQHRGKCPVQIEFVDPRFKTKLMLPKNVAVAGTPQMVQSVNQIFGADVVILQ